jgi:DnaJ-class molecular chaperone
MDNIQVEKVKPKYYAQTCPNCNGRGTVGYAAKPCPTCGNTNHRGVIFVPIGRMDGVKDEIQTV